MKVFEFDFLGDKEWIVANNLEEAKEALLDLTEDFQECLDDPASTVKELSDAEIDALTFCDMDTDEEDAPDRSAREIMASEKEIPYHLGTTNF